MDKKEAVLEIVGSALLDLREIEKQIPRTLTDIGEKEKELDSCIVML